MTRHPFTSKRGFTLVELLVSMSIGLVVMLAVFNTYAYLGRNLTRLSYRSVMENQSRRILTTIATDIRNAKSVASAPAANPSATTLTLNMNSGGTVVYDYNSGTSKLTRNPDGTGAVILNSDIADKAPVVMMDFSFLYYTTRGGSPASQFSSPAPPITPQSIKQVAIKFTLQAGTAALQGQQGTFSSYQAASDLMPLVNRQLPDGT